jgi:hypothetical protein
MTANPNDAQEALRRLADSLAEDVLNAPDEEIMSDAQELYGSAEKLAAAMLLLFEETASEQGKARISAARADIDAAQRTNVRSLRLAPNRARSLLDRAMAADPETARKLTIAARKGEGLSDDDVLTMLEDLVELGLVNISDIEKKNE